MGGLSTVILPDPIRSIDSAAFTGNYQAIGTPLSQPTRIIKVTNLASVTVTFSWDGINDHEVLPANSFVLLDVAGNKENAGLFEIQKGTQFYAKGATGVGLLYVSTYYGRQY